MKNETLTEDKAEKTNTGGVLVGKREGQTIIHNKGSLSGYLVGKTHAEGGIQAVNKSTGQPLEMQGGEVVITAPAVSDNTKREFEGKMMTNREILSTINEKGGGVSFAKGGDVPKSIKHIGASYKYGGKTMTDHEIMTSMNGGGLLDIEKEFPKNELISLLKKTKFKTFDSSEIEEVDYESKTINPFDNNFFLKIEAEPCLITIDKIKDFYEVQIGRDTGWYGGFSFGSWEYVFEIPKFNFEEFSKALKKVVKKDEIVLYSKSNDSRVDSFYFIGTVADAIKFAEKNGYEKKINKSYYDQLYFYNPNMQNSKNEKYLNVGRFTKTQIDKNGGIKELSNTKNANTAFEVGGHLADGYSIRDIADIHQVPLADLKKQVRLGMKAESEHTSSKREQMKIVKDHLFENPNYYTLLKKAGLEDGGGVSENLPKIGSKVEARWDSSNRWTTGIFKGETKNGFEVYDFTIQTPDHIEYYAEITQDSDDRNSKIFKSKNFKERNYKNYHFTDKMANGGQTESLVKDAKSGNTPARDLNNYNDVLDLEADGMVGAETGLYANGGMMANDVQMVSTKYLNSIRSQGESNWDYDLEKSIEINGVKEPIIIGYWEEFGKVSLLDGHHRLDASMSLGINKIPAIIVNRYDYPYGKVKLYDSPILKINSKRPSDLNIFKNGGELLNLKIGTLLVDNDDSEYHEKIYRLLKIDDKQFEISVFEYQKEKDSFILPIKMLKDFKLANQEEIEFYNNSKDNYDNNQYVYGGEIKNKFNSYDDFVKQNIGKDKLVITVGSGGTSQPMGGATKKSIDEQFKSLIFHNFKDYEFSNNYMSENLLEEYNSFISKYYNLLVENPKEFVNFWNEFIIESGNYDSIYSIRPSIYDENGKYIESREWVDGKWVKNKIPHYPDFIFSKYKKEMSSQLIKEYQEYLEEYAGDEIGYNFSNGGSVKQEEELNQEDISEAIETLEILYSTATRKEKQDIKEAIEGLKMLSQTN